MLHSYKNNIHILYNIIKHIVIVTSLILMYIFMQLNFDMVSHNFGLRPNNFVGPSNIFILFIFSVLSLLVKVIKVYNKDTEFKLVFMGGNLNKTTNLFNFNLTLINTVICFILATSFSLLINDFI